MKSHALGSARQRTLGQLLCSSLLLTLSFLLPAHAYANSESLETRVRAAFLFNFARYTEWPTSAGKNNSSFHFCIAQSAELKHALQQTLLGKQVLGLSPSIQLPQNNEDISRCRLLYLPNLPHAVLQAWLQAASNQAILVIGEGRSFAKISPGMVGFYLLDGRIRFAINPTHVMQSGLQMSSRLLGLADIVSVEK